MGPEVKEVPATVFVASRHRATIPDVPRIAGDANAVGAAEEAAEGAGLAIAGPSTFLYYGADGSPTTEFDLLIAFPIASKPPVAPAGHEIVDSPSFRCLALDYVGPMSRIGEGYADLMRALRDQGLRPTWESREIYKVWKDYDSVENVTELQIGLAQ